MDNSETDNLEPVDTSIQEKASSPDGSKPKKPRSRKWLYVVSSTVIAVIFFVFWSVSNYVRKAEELETRIKAMGGTVSYTTWETGFFDLNKLLRKINIPRWVNGSLSRRTNAFLVSLPITDLSPLADLTSINRLNLNNNKISDLTPLAGLTKITHLGIHGNNISDLTPLAGLTKITHLGISNNKIIDLLPLAGLNNINYLGIYNNQISDLSPLAGLTSINRLGISNNKIIDLTPLYELKKLSELNVSYNPNLTIEEINKLQKALPNCKITHNATK
jgi:Leucine Rich repeats (2 copies)